MNATEFETEMSRLRGRWASTYTPELQKLIAREVQPFSAAWWRQTVDRLIGEHRAAPLLPEIREHIARERERTASQEKRSHSQEARSFMRSMYSDEEQGTILATIGARMKGQLDDAQWSSFMKMLEGAAPKAVAFGCRQCGGSGKVFKSDSDGYEYVYRCDCAAGQGLPYPRYFAQGRVTP